MQKQPKLPVFKTSLQYIQKTSLIFFTRFVFLDLILVDKGPKSIKIGQELAFLEVSVQHTQKTMFVCNLYKIKIGTFASSDIGFVAIVAGQIPANS